MSIYAWTTDDEMAFLFGGPASQGLVNADMERINRQRRLVSMEPVSKGQMLAQYRENLQRRSFRGCAVDVDEVAWALDEYIRGQRSKDLRTTGAR